MTDSVPATDAPSPAPAAPGDARRRLPLRRLRSALMARPSGPWPPGPPCAGGNAAPRRRAPACRPSRLRCWSWRRCTRACLAIAALPAQARHLRRPDGRPPRTVRAQKPSSSRWACTPAPPATCRPWPQASPGTTCRARAWSPWPPRACAPRPVGAVPPPPGARW